MRTRLFFAVLFLTLLAAHLCHSGVLWTEEDLPLAAAKQMLYGKALYRDIWFDKPPLVVLAYLLWGARIGFVLRFFGTLYCFACCFVAWKFGRLWGEREGLWAAGLLGFALTFDIPSAVLPLAADLLLLLPHLLAVYLAYRGRAFLSGLCAGIGFLTNVKAAFVLVSCALFVWPAILPLTLGFVSPIGTAALVLWVTGSWPAYVNQVWVWPAAYAESSHVAHPLLNGVVRTLNWAGFHLALLLGAGLALFRTKWGGRWKWFIWLGLSLAGVAMGARFFPRYYFQLLPALVILAARGFVPHSGFVPHNGFVPHKFRSISSLVRLAALALFLIPFVRFGPRYLLLALHAQPDWPDLAMDRDSLAAAQEIEKRAQCCTTLYVWGYRPDIFVYTGMRAASRYLDSQAMTGVPADRHLAQSQPVALATTAESRRELARSKPDFIADGLSLYNPRLAMQNYPELRPWLANYQEFARTRTTILYRRAVR